MRKLSVSHFFSTVMVSVLSVAAATFLAFRAEAGPVRPDVSVKSCADSAVLPLETRHASLQRALEQTLHETGFGVAIQNGKLAVSVVDVGSEDEPLYAGVNDDLMMYAASLPKIAILLTVMREVEKGNLRWSEYLQKRLSDMITRSSNPAAAWATGLVGLRRIERTVSHPALCFYDPPNGGLWMGRAYRRGARARRDPLGNLSHAATARQVARFYTMLDAGIILSRRGSRRMLDTMSPVRINHKLVRGLNGRPGVEFLARKSGSWRTFHSDSALIQHGDKRYVVVVVSDLADGEGAVQRVAQVVDDLIMAGEHIAPAPVIAHRRLVPQG